MLTKNTPFMWVADGKAVCVSDAEGPAMCARVLSNLQTAQLSCQEILEVVLASSCDNEACHGESQ